MKIFWKAFLAGLCLGVIGCAILQDYEDKKEKRLSAAGWFLGTMCLILIMASISLLIVR